MNIVNKATGGFIGLKSITILICLILMLAHNDVHANEIKDQPSNETMVRGVMISGIQYAVEQYGAEGGLYNDPRFRLPMPDELRNVEKVLRMLGGKKLANRFVYLLNKTAESTLRESEPVLMEYIKTMPIANSDQLASGSYTEIADYFASNGTTDLAEKIIPILGKVSEQEGLVSTLKKMLDKARLSGTFNKLNGKVDESIINAVMAVVVYGMKSGYQLRP